MRPSFAIRRAYQIYLALFGATAMQIGLLHVMFGPSVIPGSVPVNATMDSEDRFYATLFIAFGAVMLWCVRDVERKSVVVYWLSGAFFAGGLARLVSMAAVGMPHPFFVAMTALELLLPPAMAFVQYRIAEAAVS